MKKWYKSKTMLFNLFSMSLLGMEQNLPMVQGVLGENTYGIVLFVVTMVNIGLRAVTTTGVTK